MPPFTRSDDDAMVRENANERVGIDIPHDAFVLAIDGA